MSHGLSFKKFIKELYYKIFSVTSGSTEAYSTASNPADSAPCLVTTSATPSLLPGSTPTSTRSSKEQTEPVDFSSSQQSPGFRGFEPCFPRTGTTADSLARYRPQNGKIFEIDFIVLKSK